MTKLTSTIKRKIAFYDMDAIRMVWHGNYVKYLEEGREAWGEQFGLSYMHIFDNGYVVPVVDLHLKYKNSAYMGDVLVIETTYVPSKAAKLQFEYRIYRQSDNAEIVTATSTQLFVTAQGEFDTSTPAFVSEWRKNNNQ
jgi:acyl-CoA thioester hydrolase